MDFFSRQCVHSKSQARSQELEWATPHSSLLLCQITASGSFSECWSSNLFSAVPVPHPDPALQPVMPNLTHAQNHAGLSCCVPTAVSTWTSEMGGYLRALAGGLSEATAHLRILRLPPFHQAFPSLWTGQEPRPAPSSRAQGRYSQWAEGCLPKDTAASSSPGLGLQPYLERETTQT